MDIQWYPGHMTKTKRLITENLSLVDIVVEILDARMPLASQNPLINELVGNKPRLIILNKADLADSEITAGWLSYFHGQGVDIIPVNASSGEGMNKVYPAVLNVLKEKIAHKKARGMNTTVKMMVVGIPNVGKSSFINKLAKRRSAQVGDRPGVTKGKQWIRIQKDIELLDTPGILWPKFDDKSVGITLAFAGSVKDEILDTEELACALLDFLRVSYPKLLKERYKIEWSDEESSYELLRSIGRKRGFVISGGEIDDKRAADTLLDEFRGAKIGRISLETPNAKGD